jgi:molybdopterin biosynthesis enzyme MoaB
MKKNGAACVLRVRVLGLGDLDPAAFAAVGRKIISEWEGLASPDFSGLLAGDDRRRAARTIRRWCGGGLADVVVTIGRAGHLAGDFAPEMTAPLLERALPGIEERMCLAAPRSVADLLFRGKAGMRGATLIVNLPARPSRAGAIARFLAPVLEHAITKARGSDRECVPLAGGR